MELFLRNNYVGVLLLPRDAAREIAKLGNKWSHQVSLHRAAAHRGDAREESIKASLRRAKPRGL